MKDSIFTKFAPLVAKPELWSNVLGGSTYTRDDEGDILIVFLYLNDFVRYNPSGDVLYFRQTVGPPPFPKLNPPRINSLNIKLITVDAAKLNQVVVNASIVHHHIHILIRRRNKKGFNIFRNSVTYGIDVYDLETGDYLYSYKTPFPVKNIAIIGNYLAAIPDDSARFVVWGKTKPW